MTHFDLEAEMAEEADRAAQTERAQARIDKLNALTPTGQHQALLARPDREQHRNAQRTLQLHGTPALHDWLIDLENQVIDLLHPEDQDYFRRRQ